MPFNNGADGAAEPVAGASDPAHAEYYPDFSGDDQLIAFTRVNAFASLPAAEQEMYYRPQSEVYVVPAAGGTALRLTANDPPMCSGEVSPGVHNSWPKWSPLVREACALQPFAHSAAAEAAAARSSAKIASTFFFASPNNI